MYIRLLALFVVCAAVFSPVSIVRAETADSIMESKKTLPRHKEVKKLGVHHTGGCNLTRQCRGDHVVWRCTSRPIGGRTRCICRPLGIKC